MIYHDGDTARLINIPPHKDYLPEVYRTPWRRDYARLIHSPAFRRLQGKTQLFPGQEHDFFRNRLTHSMEVAQIAKAIAIKLNHDLEKKKKQYRIEPDIPEFAALAHDLGHPPFGHLGEEALDEKMKDYGGFEGNAQTLRILTKIEKKVLPPNTNRNGIISGIDKRVGLNLTARSIAAILKYNVPIPLKYDSREELLITGKSKRLAPIKGYYQSEEDVVKFCKEKITGTKHFSSNFKTIECMIMDLADDIAYSTFDLEDSFKAGFIKPVDMLFASDKVRDNIANSVNRSLDSNLNSEDVKLIIQKIFGAIITLPFSRQKNTPTLTKQQTQDLFAWSMENVIDASYDIASNGYRRTDFTSKLVGKYIRNVEFDVINEDIPALSTIKFNDSVKYQIEVMKKFTFYYQILSPKLKVVEYRGKKIVEEIFDALCAPHGPELMPDDFRSLYSSFSDDDRINQMRTICDFIAGMTDSYAMEFYARLNSEFPRTIFKPY